MARRRIDRLNSLLKEVLSDVIRKEVRNPNVHPLFTITRVDITNDLQHADVYVSIIGNDIQKKETIKALQSAAGFIGVTASKQVVIFHFPALHFVLDDSVDKQMRIEELIQKISHEREARNGIEEDADDDDKEE